MTENFLESTAIKGSDLLGGDSSTGNMAGSQVGTPKAGGVSPLVAPHKKIPFFLIFLIILLTVVAGFAIYLFIQVRTLALEKTPISINAIFHRTYVNP